MAEVGAIGDDSNDSTVLDVASIQREARRYTTTTASSPTIRIAGYDDVERRLLQCDTSKPVLEPNVLRLIQSCIQHSEEADIIDEFGDNPDASAHLREEASRIRNEVHLLTGLRQLQDVPSLLEGFQYDERVKSKLSHPGSPSLQWPNGKKHLYNIAVVILDTTPTISADYFIDCITKVVYITKKSARCLIDNIPEVDNRIPQAVAVPVGGGGGRGGDQHFSQSGSGVIFGGNAYGFTMNNNFYGQESPGTTRGRRAASQQDDDVHAANDDDKSDAVVKSDAVGRDTRGAASQQDHDIHAANDDDKSDAVVKSDAVGRDTRGAASQQDDDIHVANDDDKSGTTASQQDDDVHVENDDEGSADRELSTTSAKQDTAPKLGWQAVLSNGTLLDIAKFKDSNGTFIRIPPGIDLKFRIGYELLPCNIVSNVAKPQNPDPATPTIQLKSTTHLTVVTHNTYYPCTSRQYFDENSQCLIRRGVFLYQELENLQGPLEESAELQRDKMKAEMDNILSSLSSRYKFKFDDEEIQPIRDPEMSLPLGLRDTYDQDFTSLSSFKEAFKSPDFVLHYVYCLFETRPNISRSQFTYIMTTKFPGSINRGAFNDFIEDIRNPIDADNDEANNDNDAPNEARNEAPNDAPNDPQDPAIDAPDFGRGHL